VLQFAGAGFPPAIVYRRGAFSEYASGGPPLGIMAGLFWDLGESERPRLSGTPAEGARP